MKPTQEQAQVVASKGRIVVVNAFAGTGKSSTLRMLAESRPAERFIYIAFNKAIQLAAQATFPSNVTCRTGHSLAYAKFGYKYQNAGTLTTDIKPHQVMNFVRGRELPQQIQRLYAARVVETVKQFIASDHAEINQVVLGHSPAEKYINEVTLRDDARAVWQMMCDCKLPMVHDGYLKLFQLTAPVLKFDNCLFDEFQDQTPAMQSIVSGQKNSRLYYVGDRHQSIYGFRGAVNAMDSIEADERFFLTGSFRFGPEVAQVANQILRLKDEKQTLKGFGASGKVISATGQVEQGHTIISRGNSALFASAVLAMDTNRPLAFVGDIRGYKLEQISDVYNLSKGNHSAVRDPFIGSFRSYSEMVEYANEVDDVNLKSRCKLVDKYTNRIPGLIDSIYKKAMAYSTDLPANTCVLTTAHKAKGLEFDRVVLTDDFTDLLTVNRKNKAERLLNYEVAEKTPEEVNVIYVAATRPRHILELSEKLDDYIDFVKQMDRAAVFKKNDISEGERERAGLQGEGWRRFSPQAFERDVPAHEQVQQSWS